MINWSMGHFLFQSIFYLLVIFEMLHYQFSFNFYNCKKFKLLMITMTSQEKLWRVIYDQRGSQS